MADKKIQKQQVLEYIKANGSIDQWRAMTDLRIMRLGARIWDLKADGVPIKTEMRTSTDGVSRYAVYSLAG